jgi:23S rRNA-/tRNA-specific pseudouridylate synthase
VLDKPAGIATTAPDAGSTRAGPRAGKEESLFALARLIDPSAPALHPLSRLDTQVTGLVTFARTRRANQLALEARRRGALWRRYLGISAARPEPERGSYDFSIGIDPRDPRLRRAWPAAPAAGSIGGLKAARTEYALRAQAGPLCALDLFPITGRTHQLRVHTSAAGCPLAGDVAYGGQKRFTLPNGRVLTAERVMLHCAFFRMPDPARPARILELELAPAADMQALWRSAGGEPALLSGGGRRES